MKLGIQTWSVQNLLTSREEIYNVFSKLKEIGFEFIEFHSCEDINKFNEMLECAEKVGLPIVSGHIPYTFLLNNQEYVSKVIKKTKLKYIVIPAIYDFNQTLQGYKDFMKGFKKIIDNYSEEDIEFAYHNHAYEFVKTKGISAVDLFESSGYIDMQFDIFHMHKGGVEPSSFIKKSKNISKLIHINEVTSSFVGEWKVELIDGVVGEGNSNYKEILQVAKEKGVQYFILEQEDFEREDQLERLSLSYSNIKNELK